MYVYYDIHTDAKGTHFKLGTWNEPAPHDVVFPKAVIYSAYTVPELGTCLPDELYDEADGKWDNLLTYPNGSHWCCAYRRYYEEDGTWDTAYVELARTEADARANMLIYLLENNLMEKP